MTLRELFDAGYALHGMHWQRALARSLGVNERTVRWWLQVDDGSRLPPDLALRLDAIFEARIHELQDAMWKLRSETRKKTKIRDKPRDEKNEQSPAIVGAIMPFPYAD